MEALRHYLTSGDSVRVVARKYDINRGVLYRCIQIARQNPERFPSLPGLEGPKPASAVAPRALAAKTNHQEVLEAIERLRAEQQKALIQWFNFTEVMRDKIAELDENIDQLSIRIGGLSK